MNDLSAQSLLQILNLVDEPIAQAQSQAVINLDAEL